MTDSIWQRGLPDGFFTRRNATILGILVGGTVVLAASGYASLKRYISEPTQAPICYGADEANYDPGTRQDMLRNERDARSGRSEYDRRDKLYFDRLQAAEIACAPTACPDKAWKEYRSALFWYLSDRLRHTRKLDMIHGDAGLRSAAEIYGTPSDRAIEQGLRDRYFAKLFRINDFRQNSDAIAMLVLEGGKPLRPCRRGDVPGP